MTYNGPLHDAVLDADYPRITEYFSSNNDASFPPEWGNEETERDLVGLYLNQPVTTQQGISIATFMIPRGASQVNLRDFRSPKVKGWGDGWPSCTGTRSNIATVTANRSGTRFNVHRKIAILVDLLADETERRGYLGKPPQCGAYNCRAIGGTSTPSNHSWGLALDWNWQENPYSVTAFQVMTMPPWVPPLWREYGFAWGGDYSGAKKDTMHLEFMGTPAQADLCTRRAIERFKTGTPQTGLPILKLTDPVMTGPAVSKVQNVLRSWYLLPNSFANGKYGPETVKVVKRAQANGTPKLTADGVVGPLTYRKLNITKV
jgi:hypothetical protein